MPVMLLRRTGLALAAALLAAAGPAIASGPEPDWRLELDGRHYRFTLTLTSALPASLLLDVLFEPRHVEVFSRSAGRMAVLSRDGAVNEIRFDTRRLFYRCTSTFRRTLDRESGSIDIEMMSFKAGWGKLAPHALASRARYTVADRGSFRVIVYRQDVETDRPVGGMSLRLVRKSLREFARDLDDYLQRPGLGRGGGAPAGAALEGGWR